MVKAKVVVPKTPKAKKLRFTSNCYAILGVTAEVPGLSLNAAQHKTAGRLVEYGLMVAKEIDVEQEAGGFKYMAKMPGYELTTEGRALYEQYNRLVKGVNPLWLRQAIVGERLKERLIQKNQKRV